MKEHTKINLFTRYCDYWIVKLGLDKRYKIIVKKDNRIANRSYVYRCDKSSSYIIKYNTNLLTNRVEILHVLLHELGHLTYDFRYTNQENHEYLAELFALKTAKETYPKYYKKMIGQTKQDMNYKKNAQCHIEGYRRALKELGELDED